MSNDTIVSLFLGVLLLFIITFCYSISSDNNTLSLQVKALRTENNCIRKRLDMIDEEIHELDKRIRTIKDESK
jgi:hypothetical protein